MKPMALRSKYRGDRSADRLPPKERFAAKWKLDETTGCWIWQAGFQPNGYGRFKLPGKNATAHRASWELHKGAIPSGLFVLHRCDRPACVNPDHLWLGTHAENMADMRAKRRQNKGTKQHAATLNEPMVYGIRAMLKHGASQDECATIFGVSRSTIQEIGTRARWAHLPDTEEGLKAALREYLRQYEGVYDSIGPHGQQIQSFDARCAEEGAREALAKFGGEP